MIKPNFVESSLTNLFFHAFLQFQNDRNQQVNKICNLHENTIRNTWVTPTHVDRYSQKDLQFVPFGESHKWKLIFSFIATSLIDFMFHPFSGEMLSTSARTFFVIYVTIIALSYSSVTEWNVEQFRFHFMFDPKLFSSNSFSQNKIFCNLFQGNE